MIRNVYQETRRFLSSAFRFDTKECSMMGAMQHTPGARAHVFKVLFKDFPDIAKVGGVVLQLTLFDEHHSVFFGATHRIDEKGRGDTVMFHTGSTRNVLLVVEVVRPLCDTVICWGSIALNSLSLGQSIELRSGSAQLLFLDKSLWPNLQSLSSHINVNVSYLLDTVEGKSLALLIPSGVFVAAPFDIPCDEFSKAIPAFRIAVSGIEIRPQRLATDASALGVAPGSSWSLLVMAHNTYRQLTPCAELELDASKDEASGDMIISSKSRQCELVGIPLHSKTCIVIVLRSRSGDRYRVAGYSVYKLCANADAVRDEDVAVRNLPFLKGPFSSADPRTLTLETEDPFGQLAVGLSMRVGFFDTPIKARQVEEVRQPVFATTQHQAEAPKIEQQAQQPQQQTPLPTDGVDQTHRIAQPAAPLLAVAAGANAPAATLQESSGDTAANLGMYKMLCSILEEVQHLRENQRQLEVRMTHPTSTNLGEERNRFGLGPKPLLDSEQESLHIIDLNPRKIAISQATRSAMANGLAQLRNPFTQFPLKDAVECSETAFPDTLVGIRFEGVTSTAAIKIVPKLAIMFSFSCLPMQQLGVIYATQVVEDADHRTYRLSSSTDSGFVWHEPLDLPQSPIVKRHKANGYMYLHLYDAVTLFYVATATIKMSAFHRPPHAPSVVTTIDAILHADLSFTERQVPEGVFPVVSNVGQLHLSLFSIGFTDASPASKAPLSEISQNGATCGGTIVATKLAALETLDKLPASQQPPIAAGAQEAERLPSLHQQRAQYVKSIMQQNGGILPGVPTSHFKANDMELEFKLRFAEKKRDEVKSLRIAETLRQRLTTTVHITAACGRPEVVQVHFVNPFPDTIRFTVDVPQTSRRYLSLAPSFAPVFTLGPKDHINVILLVRVLDPVSVGLHVGATIVTERLETVKIVDIRVTPSTPTVDRRLEVFGHAGEQVTKKFFSRVLSANSFPLSMDAAALEKRIGSLCCFCSTSDLSTNVSTEAVVDPLTQRFATAWEEVVVKTAIPTTGSKLVLVHLFYDEDCVNAFETWELAVYGCQVTQSQNIFFGQSSTISMPIPCERLYSSDPTVEVVASPGGTGGTLRVKPRAAGMLSVMLHALRGSDLNKIICHIPVTLPTPTFEQTIELSTGDAAAPVFRRLMFTNHSAAQKMFRVMSNYKYNFSVNPEVFALGPADYQHISLKIENVCVPEGSNEGRYPIWVFINDDEDKTVESYFIQIVVRRTQIFS